MSVRSSLHASALWFLSLLWLAAAPASAQQGVSKRSRELFEWFDRLGFDDVSRAKFVEVQTGEKRGGLDGKVRPELREAFLISEAPQTFTVVHADLSTRTYCPERDSQPFCSCEYRVVSLEKHARALLRQIRQPNYFRNWEAESVTGELVYRRGQIFVMARECARRGLGPLAEELIEALARHPVGDGSNAPDDVFPEGLRAQIATAAGMRAWMAIHDPSKSWKVVADGFRRFIELCPESDEIDAAKEMLVKVESLEAEDAEHARTAPKALDGLPAGEKARELVWQLRNELRLADASSQLPVEASSEGKNNATRAIRELGTEAVPALLAELRDKERLSRASNSPAGVPDQSHVLTQELVADLLDEVAGFSFDPMYHWENREERWPNLCRVAEGWWQSCQAGAERDWLARQVRGGQGPALACADRLHQKYPEAFVEAALAGLATSKGSEDFGTRRELVRLLALHRGPRVEAALVAQLEAATLSHDRMVVARLLQQWGRSEADETMRAVWQAAVGRGFSTNALLTFRSSPPLRVVVDYLLRMSCELPPPAFVPPEAYGSLQTLRYLADSDSSENLRAVLGAWPKLPFDFRFFLVDLCARNSSFRPESLASPTHRAFCQELLLAALEDASELPDGDILQGSGMLWRARVCDLAGSALHDRFPGKYPYELSATESVRDRQRTAILNVQRRELGQPEIPIPIERAKVSAARANYVTAIEWDEKSVRPDELLGRQTAGWKDQPFRVDELISAISAYAKKPQSGTVRFRLAACRDGDSTGIVIHLRLLPGQPTTSSNLRARRWITTGQQIRLDSNMSGDIKTVFGPDSWADFKRHIAEALKRPAVPRMVALAEVSSSSE